ncbi:type II toxin-antitoxin system Phd/YefM family antitoxin [Vineibacter terrae]|uniref:type II toxin-antitoxin system Phd/YefM family antitoxin n=1 Tax=Vineibacter terrae TaxID=2586908 RepID=UPI002E33E0D5|nr:type II toxin-antitoxin system Phd/YefM family antitoxin [Vineibacter terrae]HEX2885522.1 type II toxin-antitoxin system Phd/YefM family antitoxin [Vineibacter terrae]
MAWQLQDAKNKFSKVVQQARTQGPQVVTVRGERAVVVLSAEDYDSLRAARPTLVDALLDGPRWDDDFAKAVTARVKTPSRDPAF